jgi:hypothetical protein
MKVDIQHEASHLDLGDKRRNNRFINIIKNKVRQPLESIPQMGESWSDVKMTYAFYDNDKIPESRISDCIEKATVERCLRSGVVLNIMDTTSINFSSSAEGLGYLDHGMGEGLMVHSSFAVDEQGCPLGLLHQKIWARDRSQMGKKKFRHQKDITEKESYRWIESMQEAEKLLRGIELVVHVADRESDIYELFATPRPKGSELLIRAVHERKTLLGSSMWEEIQSQPVVGTFEIEIPKVTTEDVKKVKMNLKAGMVLLSPPRDRPLLKSLIVYGIIVQAVNTTTPLEWKLISTMPVTTAEQALQAVKWYSFRWRIERLHYILKSGCRLEDLQLRHVKALRKAILVYSLCAFKIMQMLYLSRIDPQQSCAKYLEQHEWEVLCCVNNKSPVPCHHPPTLKQCVTWIAKMGGYLARNNDGPPGVKNLWRGLQKLNTILKVIATQKQWLSTF